MARTKKPVEKSSALGLPGKRFAVVVELWEVVGPDSYMVGIDGFSEMHRSFAIMHDDRETAINTFELIDRLSG